MPNLNETDVDNYVGSRIKARRVELGYTQTAVANKLGLTFQQVQKYERGYNRVSASRLHDLTKILSVDVEYFFKEFRDDAISEDRGEWGPEVWELITAFSSLPEKVRMSLRLLLKSTVPSQNEPNNELNVPFAKQQVSMG